MSHLTDLTNIGSTLAERLEEIGIFNREDLEVMGAAKPIVKFRPTTLTLICPCVTTYIP